MARFVVVDDSQPFRSMLARILRQAGHQVIGEAGDGREGLALVHRLKPDAVTLDIIMPSKNGDDVARELLDGGFPVKVFMVSSMSQRAVYEPLMQAGAHFISKPYMPDKVVKIVTRGLNGKP